MINKNRFMIVLWVNIKTQVIIIIIIEHTLDQSQRIELIVESDSKIM